MSFMYSKKILKELEISISGVKEEEAQSLIRELQNARRIFSDGLGRSGLCCRAFAMRLMHLGMKSYVVGEIVTPSIGENDLLLLCSGSGESKALIAHGQKAKERGAKIALITGNEESTLGRLSDTKLVIAAPKKEAVENTSILPMGTLFEVTAALLFENLILELMKERNETSRTMFQRHANLE